MTKEDKELLLKDLCARLPYGVKVQHQDENYLEEVQTVEHISRKYGEIETESVLGFVDDFKPYLRPMSSMTEEEKEDYRKVCELDTKILSKHPMDETPFPALYNSQDWLNKNMFDYRGLIEMGLAIEAPKNMYKID